MKWRGCVGPLLAGITLNNILPFRAGDRRYPGVVAATVLVGRLLDLLILCLLLVAGLFAFRLDTTFFAGIGASAVIAFAATILVVLLFPKLFAPLLIGIGKLMSRVIPYLGERLLFDVRKCVSMLEQLAQAHTMPLLIFWSAIAWLAEGCVFWCVALALLALAVPVASWLALPVGTLATLIPSTSGYIGTFDYFAIQAMTILGNDITAASGFALLVHVLLWTITTTIGGLYFLLRQAAKQKKLEAV